MNDYQPERIICDIVELLQDLKTQGFVSITTLHGNGSVAIDLFDSQENYKHWIDGEKCAAYTGFVGANSDSNKCAQELLAMYNQIHDFKDLSEHHAMVEKMLCDREYITENFIKAA